MWSELTDGFRLQHPPRPPPPAPLLRAGMIIIKIVGTYGKKKNLAIDMKEHFSSVQVFLQVLVKRQSPERERVVLFCKHVIGHFRTESDRCFAGQYCTFDSVLLWFGTLVCFRVCLTITLLNFPETGEVFFQGRVYTKLKLQKVRLD